MKFRRITIWGNSGSGKSTLAEVTGRTLRLPVFHLDLIAWAPGWRFRDERDFNHDQRAWLAQPHWIIEGVGGWSGLQERFARADLIVHLDTPISLCQERATRRIAADNLVKNPFMAAGCRYGEVVDRQAEVIRHFATKVRSDIEAALVTNFSSKPQLRLDGSRSIDELCRQLVTAVTDS